MPHGETWPATWGSWWGRSKELYFLAPIIRSYASIIFQWILVLGNMHRTWDVKWLNVCYSTIKLIFYLIIQEFGRFQMDNAHSGRVPVTLIIYYTYSHSTSWVMKGTSTRYVNCFIRAQARKAQGSIDFVRILFFFLTIQAFLGGLTWSKTLENVHTHWNLRPLGRRRGWNPGVAQRLYGAPWNTIRKLDV